MQWFESCQVVQVWYLLEWRSSFIRRYPHLHAFRKKLKLARGEGRAVIYRWAGDMLRVAAIDLEEMRWCRLEGGTLEWCLRTLNSCLSSGNPGLWEPLLEVPGFGLEKGSLHIVVERPPVP